jgi:predicted TPR repeat methyltransferase
MEKVEEKAPISEDLRTELLNIVSFDPEKIVDHYNEICEKYEFIYCGAGWPDPFKCSELAESLVSEDKRANYQVLDMGCGTGLVG